MDDYVSINEYLTSLAAKHSSKIAVKDDMDELTYFELEQKVNSFAYFLHKNGIQKGDRIAIYLDNSTDFILSIFTIFKISCIFIPLPYDDPKERIQKILSNCQPKMIITKKEKEVYKIIQPGHTKFVVYTDKDNVDNKDQDIKNVPCYQLQQCFTDKRDFPHEKLPPGHIAYIIYTSGTTGEPKGVTIRHESIVNYINETIRIFDFNNSTKVLCASPFHFDGSFGSIFCTIKVGGTIVIMNRKKLLPRLFLDKLINDEITHWSGTPSLFKILIEELNKKKSEFPLKLRTVGLGGERCPVSFIMAFKQALPNTRIFNRYGPTETTVVVCSYEITKEFKDQNEQVPIGRPQKNVTFYAFNTLGQLIRPGEPGELYIGGIQVMTAYWQDPDLTKKVLNDDIVKGERLFKTGDMVTINNEGNYIFLDRVDNMINKYGTRIYLSEIENVIAKMDGIKDNACISIQKTDIEAHQIVAFIVLNKTLTEQELRKSLKNNLPGAMIPNVIKFVDSIPYLANGKTDRKKLENLYLDNKNLSTMARDSTQHFEKLSKIITSLAPGENVQLDETVNLMENLGFDSMMLLRLIMEIEIQYNTQFSRDEIDLENFVTIKQIINLLKKRQTL